MKDYKTVDEYINRAAPPAQEKLKEFRAIVRELAPKVSESISYGMPAYKLNGPLVYFGAFKNHVSLFATASRRVAEKFAKELEPYKKSKGTIQFPLDEPLPTSLIRKIVNERVLENTER
jgi:uncharacterized protein YdhG (YjbR/CyaY superfamily)